jgi:transcriptional regulator with XRE-family HTH domain
MNNTATVTSPTPDPAVSARQRKAAFLAWKTRRATNHTAIEIVRASICGNRIKDILHAKGLTQEELARRVGVSYRHINRLVLGASGTSLLIAKCIETVLETSLDRLFMFTIDTRARVQREKSKAASARAKQAVSRRQRAAAYKAWQTRRANAAALKTT